MARTSSIHVYNHFDLYLKPVTLAFNLSKNVSNGTSPPQGQCSRQIRTDALTHGRTHIHRTKIVTTMSRLPASGLDKKDQNKLNN